MTPRERDVLGAIRSLTRDGVSPSYEMIGRAIGVPSKANISRLVHSLEQQGLIRLTPHAHRKIELVGDAYDRDRLETLSSHRLGQMRDACLSILAERLAVGT